MVMLVQTDSVPGSYLQHGRLAPAKAPLVLAIQKLLIELHLQLLMTMLM